MIRSGKSLFIYTAVILGACSVTFVAHAQEFVPLIPVPGLNYGNPNVQEYLNVVYVVAIGAASILAVGRIIYAGLRIVFSQIVTERVSAKKDLQSAFLGLFIIIAATTILTTINPELTNLPALDKAPQLNLNRQRAEVVNTPSITPIVSPLPDTQKINQDLPDDIAGDILSSGGTKEIADTGTLDIIGDRNWAENRAAFNTFRANCARPSRVTSVIINRGLGGGDVKTRYACVTP